MITRRSAALVTEKVIHQANLSKKRGRTVTSIISTSIEQSPSEKQPTTPKKQIKLVQDNADNLSLGFQVDNRMDESIKSKQGIAERTASSTKSKQVISERKATSAKSKQTAAERKLASYRSLIQASPFPNHSLPTTQEAEMVAWLLAEHHGYKRESQGGSGLPRYTPAKGEDKWGGCGDVASVLEAVIRTVLSCNTSNQNSAAAHKSLTERFGKNNWQAIMDAPESQVVDAIRCGGLANNKARTIQGVLRNTFQKYGVLSLDHLHQATDDEIMQELVSFNGVGPKVASCVLAFCIGRESMAVDTHVFRLSKALGWVPEKATRDQTYYHLHERVAGHLKYALHVLLIQHGRTCPNCSAKRSVTEKNESAISSGEEKETKVSNVKGRACPLKAAGLLGRRLTALLPKTPASGTAIKMENAESLPSLDDLGTLTKPSIKKEETTDGLPSNDGIDYAYALQTAQNMNSNDLFRILQKAKNTTTDNPICEKLKQKGMSLQVVLASQLSSEQKKKIFAIFEENMKSMYKNSTLGWKPFEKKTELFDDASRFLLIRPSNSGTEIAGYAMWRFDTEICAFDDPLAKSGETELEIVYLYEIQVSKSFQQHGIGTELVESLLRITQHTRMRKLMLTVYINNPTAKTFYQNMGFFIDRISPLYPPSDYEIMSKPMS